MWGQIGMWAIEAPSIRGGPRGRCGWARPALHIVPHRQGPGPPPNLTCYTNYGQRRPSFRLVWRPDRQGCLGGLPVARFPRVHRSWDPAPEGRENPQGRRRSTGEKVCPILNVCDRCGARCTPFCPFEMGVFDGVKAGGWYGRQPVSRCCLLFVRCYGWDPLFRPSRRDKEWARNAGHHPSTGHRHTRRAPPRGREGHG